MGAAFFKQLLRLAFLFGVLIAPAAANSPYIVSRSTMASAQTTDVFLAAYGFPTVTGQPTIDLYFQAFDTWSTVSPPDPNDRWYAGAGAVATQKVFVIAGGYRSSPTTYYSDLIIVNYTGVVDAATAQSVPSARKVNGNNAFANGCMGGIYNEVYWAGGENSTGAVELMRLYDPVANTYRAVTPNLSTPRSRLSCVAYPDVGGTSLLMAGGRDTGGTVLDVIQGWRVPTDPLFTGAWLEFTPMTLSVARENMAVALTPNYILFAGGFDGTTYSTLIDMFRTSDLSAITGGLSAGRIGIAAAVTVTPELVLFIGGYNGTSVTNITDVLSYNVNPPINQPQIPEFQTPRWLASAISFDSRAYLVGGQKTTTEISASGVTGTVNAFDPGTFNWTVVPPGTAPPTSSLTSAPPTTAPPPSPSPSPSPSPTIGPSSTSGGTTPPPTTPACVGSAPAPGAVCVSGVWTVTGDVNLPGPIVVVSPVVINGNATFVGAEVTGITAGVPLTIIGEATVSGVLVLALPTAPIDGQSIPILQAGSINGSFSNVTVQKNYADADCQSVSGTSSETPTSVSVLISVQEQDCSSSKGLSKGAIIGIAVGGVIAVVIMVVAVFAIALAYNAKWAKRVVKGTRVGRRSSRNTIYE